MVTLKCNSYQMKTMKKIRYIFLALAAVTAVSCSKHNTDGPQPLNSYIFFDAGMSDIVETKTEQIPVDVFQNDGTAFGVLGFYQKNAPIFNGYTNKIARVYREDGLYKYDNLAVWQGTSHRFSAFYPYDDDELLSSVKVGTDDIPYIEYTQPWYKSDMKDILGAYTEVENANPTSTNEPVKFRFQHLLWKFNVVIKNSQTLEVTAEGNIENPALIINEVTISLKNFPGTADLKLNDGFSIDYGPGVSEDCVLYSDENGGQITSGNSYTYEPLLFIPVTGLSFQLTIKYTTPGGVNDTFVYQYESEAEFSKGQVYNLTIDKTNDKFFVGIIYEDENRWIDWENNVDHTFE